jgi:hypothetical protein
VRQAGGRQEARRGALVHGLGDLGVEPAEGRERHPAVLGVLVAVHEIPVLLAAGALAIDRDDGRRRSLGRGEVGRPGDLLPDGRKTEEEEDAADPGRREQAGRGAPAARQGKPPPPHGEGTLDAIR